MVNKPLTMKELKQSKYDSIMNVINERAGYYRANPQRFAEDIGLHLKLFQKILIYAMMCYNYFMFIACRGIGKTYLTALFCVLRCILYPGTKIVVVSGTVKQATEVLTKIQKELMPKSPFLRNEIADVKIGINDSIINFKNGQWITTSTSTDNARGQRANLIICDEFRLINQNILNSVIRKFLGPERHPLYLDKPEYASYTERNKELYLSSAWFKTSWAYKKAQTYTANFFDPNKKYFICDLPYQLSIKEGLRSRAQTEDEMSEPDFDPLSWSMEMDGLWWSDNDGSLFSFDEFNKQRKIKMALFPLEFYNDKFPVPKVKGLNRRILSVDVALMATTKKHQNDAAPIFINDLIQSDAYSYQSNFVYGQTFEGLTTDALGIIIMRYFYHYGCTDLVIDVNGNGLGVADFIMKDQYDSETGETYKALTFVNNDELAMRCKVPDANKVCWGVKATVSFNSDICVALRNGIKNGKINFLVSEDDCDEYLEKNVKTFAKSTNGEKSRMKIAYAETTMAEYQLIKLKHTVVDGNIKVKEMSGMRKDRYSSIAYNFWCANQLEYGLRPSYEDTEDLFANLPFKKAAYLR